MNIDIIRDHCLSLPYVTEDMPFDQTTLVFRVGGKMFALTDLEASPVSCTLKCDPERALQLREHYDSIKPGYHMNKQHWNSVYIDGDVDVALLHELIEHSYQLIHDKLTKKQKEALIVNG